VSDAAGPSKFTCQLTSSRLALELLTNNMNEVYVSSSQRRHSRQHGDDKEANADSYVECLDVSASSRHDSYLERPLGVLRLDDDVDDDMPATEEPQHVDSVCGDDGDYDEADVMLTSDQLQPGTFCAAFYPADHSWYRARVKSVDGDVIQIVFVDYGTESAVSVGELRWLKDRFTSAKMMSFPCCLEGWEEEEQTSADAVEQFRELVLDRRLIADVLSTTDAAAGAVKYVVRLLDMGLSISDRLKNPDIYKPVAVCVTSATSPHDFWCRCVDNASTTELPLLMDRIAYLYAGDDQPPSSSDLSLDDDEMLYAARYTDGVWYRAKVISSHQSSTPATVDVLFVDYGTKTEVLACDLQRLPDDFRTLPPQAVHCRLAGVEPMTAGDAAVWDDASMSRFVELVMCTDDERTFQLHPVNVMCNAEGSIVEMSGRLMDGDRDIGAQLIDSGYAVESASLKPTAARSGVEHRRRSSSLSDERCNLFVSFDAGTEGLEELAGAEAEAEAEEKALDEELETGATEVCEEMSVESVYEEAEDVSVVPGPAAVAGDTDAVSDVSVVPGPAAVAGDSDAVSDVVIEDSEETSVETRYEEPEDVSVAPGLAADADDADAFSDERLETRATEDGEEISIETRDEEREDVKDVSVVPGPAAAQGDEELRTDVGDDVSDERLETGAVEDTEETSVESVYEELEDVSVIPGPAAEAGDKDVVTDERLETVATEDSEGISVESRYEEPEDVEDVSVVHGLAAAEGETDVSDERLETVATEDGGEMSIESGDEVPEDVSVTPVEAGSDELMVCGATAAADDESRTDNDDDVIEKPQDVIDMPVDAGTGTVVVHGPEAAEGDDDLSTDVINDEPEALVDAGSELVTDTVVVAAEAGSDVDDVDQQMVIGDEDVETDAIDDIVTSGMTLDEPADLHDISDDITDSQMTNTNIDELRGEAGVTADDVTSPDDANEEFTGADECHGKFYYYAYYRRD